MSNKSSLGPYDYEKRSKLSHVKGTGASGYANKTWLLGKITSIMSIPLVLYVFISFLMIHFTNTVSLKDWFAHIINTSIFILAIVVFFWHILTAIEEAIQDYIHAHGTKFFALILVRFFTILMGLIIIVSVFIIAFKN